MPWIRLFALFEPHYPKAGPKGGRPSMPLETMLRVYFLHQWYALSDPMAEEMLYGSDAMRRSAGIERGDERISSTPPGGFVRPSGRRCPWYAILPAVDLDLKEVLADGRAISQGETRRSMEILSRRESDVARAYASGETYRDIASRFGISPNTVRTHLQVIYRKLGVSSKIELLKHVEMSGEVSASPSEARAASSEDDRPSLAVIPFDNRSGDPADDALIDGLVDRVTAALSRVGILLTIAAASSLTYRNAKASLDAIGRDLRARYLVRGAFHRDRHRLRISAELIDVETRTKVWSDAFDGAWSDIFDMQDEVAASVAGAMVPEIWRSEIRRANRKPTSELTAWELHCRSYHNAMLFSVEGYRRARRYAEMAIEQDDDFAAPHALLARIDFMRFLLFGGPDGADLLERARIHARNAHDRDDRDETAYCCLVCSLAMAGAHQDAMAICDEAVEINGNNAESYNSRAFAHLMSPTGDPGRIISDSRAALRLSPRDPMRWTFRSNIGLAYLSDDETGDPEEALTAFRDATLSPRAGWPAHVGAALAGLALDRPEVVDLYVGRARAAQPDLNARYVEMAFAHSIGKSPGMAGLVTRLARVLDG